MFSKLYIKLLFIYHKTHIWVQFANAVRNLRTSIAMEKKPWVSARVENFGKNRGAMSDLKKIIRSERNDFVFAALEKIWS